MTGFSYSLLALALAATTDCAGTADERTAALGSATDHGATGNMDGSHGATAESDDHPATSAGSGGGRRGGASVDANDPPVPTAACGDDLDVHNGTLLPEFNAPARGGAFVGDPLKHGALKLVLEDKTLTNPDPRRNDFKVTAYAPSRDGTTPEAGPFPLIVVLPGFSGTHTSYRLFTDHFVSHGFAVLGITCANVSLLNAANNPANVDEIRHGIRWALEESQLKGKIDLGRMAIAGHSHGGKLAFFTAALDPRFKLVLGWDPQNGGGAPCFVAGAACDKWPVAPVCDPDRMVMAAGMMANIRGETLVFAARDKTVTPDAHLRAEHFYRGAPSPASMLLLPNARHADWGADNATTTITKRVQMALLLTRLMGKTGLDAYLPGGSYAESESTVVVHVK